MRASSSWIKLQFVVRKHVMNTYQMHTLFLFLFYHFLHLSLSLPLPLPCSLIFLSFWLYPPSLQLISSLFFWWPVILMWHVRLCCIMYPFVCTCVCICVCTHFLDAYIYVICIWECSHCCPLSRVSVSLWTNCVQTCPLVHLLRPCSLSHLITGLCGDVLICRL